MKKIFVLLFGLLAASQSFAQTTVCNAGNATTVALTADMFVVRSFNAKCSANVHAVYRQNAIAFAVGAISIKGKSRFQGNTGGGAVNGSPCTNSAVCVDADADTGLQAALDAAT